MVLSPAAFAELSVDGRGGTGGLSDGCPGTHIPTLPVILVGHDVVVRHRIQNLGPVQSGKVTEIWVLLDPHSSSCDVHQAVEADLTQLEHFERNQGVVEEQVVASDDRQVGEEVAETLQAVDPEHQQVVGDHRELWKTEAPEVLCLGPEHEQDLQVAFDHGAVLEGLEAGHTVSNVLLGTNCEDKK